MYKIFCTFFFVHNSNENIEYNFPNSLIKLGSEVRYFRSIDMESLWFNPQRCKSLVFEILRYLVERSS
jgi:hypothetical protein